LLPFLPIATEDICLSWLFKIISPHNQLPPIFGSTTILSPQMFYFIHCKGKVGIGNVITKRIFASEIYNQGGNQIMERQITDNKLQDESSFTNPSMVDN